MAGLKIISEAEFYSMIGLSEDGSSPSAGGDNNDDGFSDEDEQSFMEVDEAPATKSKPAAAVKNQVCYESVVRI